MKYHDINIDNDYIKITDVKNNITYMHHTGQRVLIFGNLQEYKDYKKEKQFNSEFKEIINATE